MSDDFFEKYDIDGEWETDTIDWKIIFIFILFGIFALVILIAICIFLLLLIS